MGQQENAQALRNLHSAFTSGNMDKVMALFSDDATWHVAGNNPTSGDFRGKDEVRRSMEETVELSGGTFNPEMHDIAASDEHAVFIGRLKAQRSGRTMDEPVAVVFHVNNGKISEVWEMAYNQKAVDAFWS